MALTVTQLEAQLGRFLRTLLPLLDGPVASAHLEAMAAGLANAARNYVTSGTLGTQADRLEAMMTMGRAIFAQLTAGDGADGAAGQHYFENHWLPRKQAGDI